MEIPIVYNTNGYESVETLKLLEGYVDIYLPDLKYAKVSVSILNSKNIKETLAGLKKSSGFLRSELAKRINLRNTPELVFELDESLEYGARIDKIINDLKKDNK